jgi:tetratricopeptide (TPR) repeat protein
MGSGLQINTTNVNVPQFLETLRPFDVTPFEPVLISSADPISLGVHRSELDHSGEMPQYVARTADTEIHHRVEESQRRGGFLLLVGDSTAGKTRSAYEALRAVAPHKRVWAPIDGHDLLRHLKDLAELGKDCFLWLDDLERYIGPEALTPTVLAVIRQLGIPVISTIRAEQYRRLTPAEGGKSVIDDERAHNALGSRVLQQLDTLVLPRLWDDTEIERARKAADRRVVNAVDHSTLFGVAEYLAAGPRLYQEWVLAGGPDANPRGAALVAAAVDCARAGVTGPVPISFLFDLHEIYLTRAGGDLLRPESWDEAVEWASRRRYGVTSLLLPIKAGSYYRVFDYLPDSLARSGAAPSIPAQTWNSVLAFARLSGLSFHVGMAAVQFGEFSVAEQAWKEDLDKNPVSSRINLGRLYRNQDRLEEAKHVWAEAVDLGSIDAAIFLGSEFETEGRIHRAITLYRKGADQGDTHAIRHLAVAISDPKERLSWWLRLTETDESGDAAFSVGHSYFRLGDRDSAAKWWKAALEKGNLRAMNNYALLLLEEGSEKEGLEWLERAANAGNPKAMINWAEHLTKISGTDDAVRLLKRAVELEEWSAYSALGYIYMGKDDPAEAELCWAAGYERGDANCAYNLGRRFQDKEDMEKAKEAYRFASEREVAPAAFNYAFMLVRDGDFDEAEIQFRRALPVAGAEDVCDFATELSRKGLFDESLPWFGLALLKGHDHAGCSAGQILIWRNEWEDGARLMRLALAAGHAHAGERLAEYYVRAGLGATAAKVLREMNSGGGITKRGAKRRPSTRPVKRRKKRR